MVAVRTTKQSGYTQERSFIQRLTCSSRQVKAFSIFFYCFWEVRVLAMGNGEENLQTEGWDQREAVIRFVRSINATLGEDRVKFSFDAVVSNYDQINEDELFNLIEAADQGLQDQGSLLLLDLISQPEGSSEAAQLAMRSVKLSEFDEENLEMPGFKSAVGSAGVYLVVALSASVVSAISLERSETVEIEEKDGSKTTKTVTKKGISFDGKTAVETFNTFFPIVKLSEYGTSAITSIGNQIAKLSGSGTSGNDVGTDA